MRRTTSEPEVAICSVEISVIPTLSAASTFGDFCIEKLLRRIPSLRIFLLIWDFPYQRFLGEPHGFWNIAATINNIEHLANSCQRQLGYFRQTPHIADALNMRLAIERLILANCFTRCQQTFAHIILNGGHANSRYPR